MVKNTYSRISAIILFFSLLLLLSFTAAAKIIQQQQILVLHSYDPSYQWTSDLQKGIDDAIASTGTDLKLSIEYLDTKRIFNEEYLESLRQYIRRKYANYRFDGIIITDDNALRFLNSFKMDSLRNLPTVAVGIGDLNATLEPTTSKGTVVFERDYIEENIKLIMQLKPNIRNLYYLADHSVSSVLLRAAAMPILEKYPSINVVEIRDLPLKEAQSLLQSASEDDAVLLTHFNTEKAQNIYHGYDKVAYYIGGGSQPTVFVLWEFYIQNGVLGGYVNRSYQLGIQAVKIIGNQLPKALHVSLIAEKLTGPVFDYRAILKHNLNESQLPPDAIIRGKPESIIHQNIYILMLSGTIIGILTLIIFILILLLRRKRQINQQNKQIVALQNKTLNVQKDLINVLGEAIETRSGETGHHVKRVTKVSVLLGQLYGLSASECEIIEIISPMHDVGKIGIPETILEKPGKLTAEEWSIMQSHAYVGFKLLSSSDGEIIHQAAIIALEHHEHWDGNGYPYSKSGTDIHIFARITAIADVFDALLSKRCYKDAWPIEKVITLFKEQKGKQFDPKLTELLLHNMDKFIAIRNKYPDLNQPTPTHPATE